MTRESASVNDYPCRRYDVRVRNVGGERVVFRDGRSVMLSESAFAIWLGLAGKNTIAEIAAKLAEEFEIPYEEAVVDMTDTVDGLVANDIAVLGTSSHSSP